MSSPNEEAARSSSNAESKDDGVEKQSSQPQIGDHGGDENELRNPYFADAAPSQDGGKRKLPPWLDHFNAKDLKKLFKCCLAIWLHTILIFINPSLNVLGQAAFVGCIVLFIIPPAGILFFHIIGYVSVLVGLALGWAWGVIVMKAALAARPASVVQAKFAQLEKMAQSTPNPAQFVQIQLLQGYMLDTRVTLVYFCLIGLFIYLVARLRVAVPKLTPVQMFACIISIVFLVEAPLLPTFSGTMPKLIVTPVAIAAGIGLVCSAFVFPTSASSETLDGMEKLLSPMPAFLDASLLAFKNPRRSMKVAALMETKFGVTMAYKALEPSMMFLPVDFSMKRWSPSDISALGEPLRRVVTSFVGLVEAHRAMEEHREKDTEAMKMLEATYNEPNNADNSKLAPQLGHHQVERDVDFRAKTKHPSRDDLIEKSFHALAISSEPLLLACKESFAAVSEGISDSTAHSSRQSAEPDKQQKHVDVLHELRQRRDALAAVTAQNLLPHHGHLFDGDGSLRMEDDLFPPVNGIMLALLFVDRLLQVAASLDKLLSATTHLESARTKSRLWLPKRVMAILHWVSEPDDLQDYLKSADTREATAPAPAPTTPETPDTTKYSGQGNQDNEPKDESAQAQLAAMRRPNSRKRAKGGQVLLKFVRWISSTESIFALRLLVVTIALCVPAVIPSSAGFFYREKGLWAVIMAQLALVPYSGDLVQGILVRSAGTVVGGVMGMVAWYIGAGGGPGNPYGMAAIMAVIIVALLWWRLFMPPTMMPAGIMLAATTFLVVCDGWIDTHLPSYGSPGVGYSIFWRRVVLVLVGFAATVVVNFLPRPPSANRHCRRVLAESIASVRDRYALFASNWANPASDLRQVAEQEAVINGETLLSIMGPIKLTVFEFSTSNYDAASLGRVCQLCTRLNHGITQLLLCTADIAPEHRASVVPSTGAVNEGLVADVMAVLSLAQQALKSSDPLPAVLPTPLFSKSVALARQRVREGSDLRRVFGADNLGGDRLRTYVVFTNALVQILGVVDELILELKRSVGETSDMVLVETV